jgi:fucose permease
VTDASPTTRTLRRARVAITLIFFVNGALVASWVSRIPLIKEKLGLDTGELSIALLGSPLGLLLAMRVSTRMVGRLSSRVAVGIGAGALAACLVLPALAWSLPSLTAALVIFGLAVGVLDITMNTQAVAVERGYGRSVIAGIHGAYSVGLLVGGAVGAAAAAGAVQPLTHFALSGLVFGVAGAVASVWLLGGSADERPDPTVADSSTGQSWNTRLAILGLIAFCALLVEGSVADWSGIYLHEVLGASLGLAALGAAACGAGMVMGRFLGDPLIARFGHQAVLSWGALLAVIGMLIGVAAPNPEVAIAGYGLLGIGIAPAMPIATILGAVTTGLSPTWAISRLTTAGYAGHLTGPPFIGLIAHETSLGFALLIPAVAAFLIIPLNRLATVRRGRVAIEPSR